MAVPKVPQSLLMTTPTMLKMQSNSSTDTIGRVASSRFVRIATLVVAQASVVGSEVDSVVVVVDLEVDLVEVVAGLAAGSEAVAVTEVVAVDMAVLEAMAAAAAAEVSAEGLAATEVALPLLVDLPHPTHSPTTQRLALTQARSSTFAM